MTEFIQIFTTAANTTEAKKIAEVLLNKKLAACAQITGPINSAYRWKGKIEEAEEFLCSIKSRRSKFNEAAKVIKENHSYEIPEIIAVPISDGVKDYLRWLEAKIG